MIKSARRYISEDAIVEYVTPYYTRELFNFDVVCHDPDLEDAARLVAVARWCAQYTDTSQDHKWLLRTLGTGVLDLAREIAESAGLKTVGREVRSFYDKAHKATDYNANQDRSAYVDTEAPGRYASTLIAWSFLADRPELYDRPFRLYLIAQAKSRAKVQGEGAMRQRIERQREEKALSEQIARQHGYRW